MASRRAPKDRFCICRQGESGKMVQCDRCDEWYHYGCLGLREDPPPDQSWYCGYCVSEAEEETASGRKRRNTSPSSGEPAALHKRQLVAPKWRDLLARGYLHPGDSVLFVRDIATHGLRYVHEGIILDREGTIEVGGKQVFPSLAAFCLAMGDRSKKAFLCSYTAAFVPLEQLRYRCARALDAPPEGPPPHVPAALPPLPIPVGNGAAALTGRLGPDRCFHLQLQYQRPRGADTLPKALGLLSQVVDAVLDFNMYFMPEEKAGKRPLLYKVALDPELLHALRRPAWEYAQAREWVGPEAEAAPDEVQVEVLFPKMAVQRQHGAKEAARLWRELLDLPPPLRPAEEPPAGAAVEPRERCGEAAARLARAAAKQLGEVPGHVAYLPRLAMATDFLSQRVQGVNELAAFLGQRGSGQFAHLGDYVRGQSYRKPILHLAAVDVMVASEEPEARVWYCMDKDTERGEEVLGFMDERQISCPFFAQHRDVKVPPDLFDCCVVQHEGELVVQPMFCISQTASLCLSLSFGQNAYPYPAKFVPPADPHFQPHRVACGCGRPGLVLDDAVAHLTSSLGHPLAPGAPRRL